MLCLCILAVFLGFNVHTKCLQAASPTWISKRPRSIYIAYVRCDADCQDPVHQRDESTVPFVAPGSVNVTQDKVERHPAG